MYDLSFEVATCGDSGLGSPQLQGGALGSSIKIDKLQGYPIPLLLGVEISRILILIKPSIFKKKIESIEFIKFIVGFSSICPQSCDDL